MEPREAESGASPFRKPPSRSTPTTVQARVPPLKAVVKSASFTDRPGPRLGGHLPTVVGSLWLRALERKVRPWLIGSAALLILVTGVVLLIGPSGQDRRACEIYTETEVQNLWRANLASTVPLLNGVEITAHELGIPPDRVRTISAAGWCPDRTKQTEAAWWQTNKLEVETKRAKDAVDAEAQKREMDAINKRIAESQKFLDELRQRHSYGR